MTTRAPRSARTTTTLPSLQRVAARAVVGGIGLWATLSGAPAAAQTPGDAAVVAGDAGADRANDAGPGAGVPVVEPVVLGGVPMRTGGAPPSHGACACHLSPPTEDGAAGALASGVVAYLIASRRRSRR